MNESVSQWVSGWVRKWVTQSVSYSLNESVILSAIESISQCMSVNESVSLSPEKLQTVINITAMCWKKHSHTICTPKWKSHCIQNAWIVYCSDISDWTSGPTDWRCYHRIRIPKRQQCSFGDQRTKVMSILRARPSGILEIHRINNTRIKMTPSCVGMCHSQVYVIW